LRRRRAVIEPPSCLEYSLGGGFKLREKAFRKIEISEVAGGAFVHDGGAYLLAVMIDGD